MFDSLFGSAKLQRPSGNLDHLRILTPILRPIGHVDCQIQFLIPKPLTIQVNMKPGCLCHNHLFGPNHHNFKEKESI